MKAFNRINLPMRQKVAIIGAGYVGASIAYALMIRRLAKEIVLIDKLKDRAIGEARDIRHGIPFVGTSNIYAGEYSNCVDSDLIIITAGRNRKPNETRLDMAADNISIVHEVIQELKKYYTTGVIMVVSNPVDIIVQKCTEWMELPDGVVFGTGCILDTSRLINYVADYVGLNTEVISGFVYGEHGDMQIPMWSRVSVAGVPIEGYCYAIGLEFGDAQKKEIAYKVKKAGIEIIKGKGRTHYGIATCVCYLADAILNRRTIIASVSSTLRGEYNIENVALSIPSIIGSSGVERRIQESLNVSESDYLYKASKQLKNVLVNL